jgi:hypothetical protein
MRLSKFSVFKVRNCLITRHEALFMRQGIETAPNTYGMCGEAAKEREHYAKAQAGGIREKDRLNALR